MSWNPPQPYALLLQDGDNINARKGSLLVKLSQEEVRGLQKQHRTPGALISNFKCLENPNIKLYCGINDVQPLTDKQKDFLQGVANAPDRLEALSKLEWAERLTIGLTVYVNIRTFSTAAKGALRYIGTLPGESGIKFGIELQECKYSGTSNGKYRDRQYFQCEDNCGVFVGLDRVSGHRVTIVGKVPTNRSKSMSAMNSPSAMKSTSVMNTVRQKSEEKQEQKQSIFQIGDRVMAFDEIGGTVYGTVRWTGGGIGSMGEIVGIETDVAVDAMRFGGHVTYLYHFFEPSGNKGREYQLFLPFDCILKNTEDTLVNTCANKKQDKYAEKALKGIEDSLVDKCANKKQEYANKANHYSGEQNTPTDSSSGTPLTMKNRAIGLFDDDNDDDDLFSLKVTPESKSSNAKTSEPSKVLQQNRDGQSTRQSVDSLSPAVQSSTVPSSGNEVSLPEVAQLREDLKTLENQVNHLEGNHDAINFTIKGLHQKINEIEQKYGNLQTRMDNYQQKTEETFKRMVDDQQKTEEALKRTVDDQQKTEEALNRMVDDQQKTEETLKRTVDDQQKTEEALKRTVDDQQKTEEVLKKIIDEQQKTEEALKRMVDDQQRTEEAIRRTVEKALQEALEEKLQEALKEKLQESNAHLKNQLSLTQQQLLGVQSMMTSSRLWVVSHDQFTIGKEIGRGAWATVHAATFRGATVAAKCLHELIIAPSTKQLFQREMEMALQCQHQNIVTFLGATLNDPSVILMELMDSSLRSAYERSKIEDHQVVGILYDVASALHFLHTRPDPVIHRDVSSANVLLKTVYKGKWMAKLGDLGTAKLQRLVTTAGPGAMVYGAPEAANPTEHSSKMDVYSFGVLIAEILTKTLPFQNLPMLKDEIQQQFPQYHQLVTSCTNHGLDGRPTMFDVIIELDKIKTHVTKP